MDLIPIRKSFVKAVRICPLYAHLIFVEGKNSSTAFAKEGIRKHEARERWLSSFVYEWPKGDLAFKQDMLDILANDRYQHMWDTFDYEWSFSITEAGDFWRAGDKTVWFTGTIDRIGYVSLEKIVLVEDMKTGYMRIDDEYERHSYIHAAKLLLPERKNFRFDYYYPRHGDDRVSSHYTWKGKRTVEITGPDGETETLRARGVDPLFKYMLNVRNEIINTPPDPKPGAHCDSLYGEPCPFQGTDCTLAPNLPDVLRDTSVDAPELAEILNLPVDRQPGAMFLYLLSQGGAVEGIPHALITQAYEGVGQAKQAVKKVEDAIKNHVKNTGENIHHHGREYGFRPPRSVDKDAVLTKLRANGWSMDQISKLVSISYDSLVRHLPDGDLKDKILKQDVTEGSPQWGEIKE